MKPALLSHKVRLDILPLSEREIGVHLEHLVRLGYNERILGEVRVQMSKVQVRKGIFLENRKYPGEIDFVEPMCLNEAARAELRKSGNFLGEVINVRNPTIAIYEGVESNLFVYVGPLRGIPRFVGRLEQKSALYVHDGSRFYQRYRKPLEGAGFKF